MVWACWEGNNEGNNQKKKKKQFNTGRVIRRGEGRGGERDRPGPASVSTQHDPLSLWPAGPLPEAASSCAAVDALKFLLRPSSRSSPVLSLCCTPLDAHTLPSCAPAEREPCEFIVGIGGEGKRGTLLHQRLEHQSSRLVPAWFLSGLLQLKSSRGAGEVEIVGQVCLV
jgi:hypothetical protein